MCRQCGAWGSDKKQCYHCRAPRYAEVASDPEAKSNDAGAPEPAKAGEDDQVKIKGRLAKYEKILQIHRQLAAEDPEDFEVQKAVADYEARVTATKKLLDALKPE